jgi:hypothetical protein
MVSSNDETMRCRLIAVTLIARLLFCTLLIANSSDANARSLQLQKAIEATEYLQKQGFVARHPQFELWYAADLSPQQAKAFEALLAHGIPRLRAFLGELQDQPIKPLQFFVSTKTMSAHVRGDVPTMVYLPAWQVLDQRSPCLFAVSLIARLIT